MLWPWIVTSATRPSSTACRKRLKVISGSRGCCLVTMDQSSRPISRSRSQRPRLRETGLFKRTPPDDARRKSNTRSQERQSSVRDRGFQDLVEGRLDDARRLRSDRRRAAAREPGDPENLVRGRQDGNFCPCLARDLGVDEHVLELPRPAAEQRDAVTRRRRPDDELGGQRVGVEEGARRGRPLLAPPP